MMQKIQTKGSIAGTPLPPARFEKGEWLVASVELAASPAELKAFVRVLYLGVIALDKEGKVSQQLKDQGKGWSAPAKSFLKSLKVGPELVDEIYKALNGKANEDTLTQLSKEFRRVMKRTVLQDPAVGATSRKILKAATAYFINFSDRPLNNLRKFAPALNEQLINQEMIKEAGSQQSMIRALNKIVKVVTGKPGQILDEDQDEKLKKKNKPVWKEYKRLRRDYNAVWKEQLRNYIFKKKVKTVDYKEAVDMLKGLKIDFRLPEGFDGLIDANGALYTKGGRLIKGMPSPELYKVVMNPEYNDSTNDQYVFTAVKINPNGIGKLRAHFYTTDYRKGADKGKHEKVGELTDWIDKGGRKKWLPWVKKGGKEAKDPRVVASAILELIFQFSARVGSGTGENSGITTVKVGNFKPMPKGAIIKYKGKDSVVQIHKLEPTTPEGKAVVEILKACADGKGPKDKLFTYVWKGKPADMTAVRVNKWFRQLGAPTTVHKLRHYRANKMFETILKKNESKLFNPDKPLNEKMANMALKQIAEKIGEVLGHVRGVGKEQKVTGATALAAYISHELIIGFYSKLGLKPPSQYTHESDEA